MASKDLCAVCEKPFYGKQKSIRFGKCDSRFHCNCLQIGVSETYVSASTGKSALKCNNCKKLTVDTVNEHSIAKSNPKETLSTEIQCTASRIKDDSLSAKQEAVHANGICTMEMVQSLVVMVSKFSSEIHQLRIDDILKTQL
jgi:hypothetical protein